MNTVYNGIVMKAAAWERAILKSNKSYPVGVGIVDTGIYPHIDLKKNIIDFYDCIEGKQVLYDDNGHGTHIAGIIAGSGEGSGGRFRGLSTEARLVVIKGLDAKGGGSVLQVVNGIEYLIDNRKRHNIKLMNISMGGTEEEYIKYKPLLKIVEEAWDLGITVCVAAGNSGPLRGSITIPGTSKKVITVGASDDNIPIKGSNSGKTIVNYSGKGPTKECIIKPDVLCPGTDIISCQNSYEGYTSKSGTSMSTAIMTGMASLLLAENPDMTPKDVKKTIKDKGTELWKR